MVFFKKHKTEARNALNKLLNDRGGIDDFILEKMISVIGPKFISIDGFHGSVSLAKSPTPSHLNLGSAFRIDCACGALSLYGLPSFSIVITFHDMESPVGDCLAEFWVSREDLSNIDAESFLYKSGMNIAGIDIFDPGLIFQKEVMNIMLFARPGLGNVHLAFNGKIRQPPLKYHPSGALTDNKRVGITTFSFSFSFGKYAPFFTPASHEGLSGFNIDR